MVVKTCSSCGSPHSRKAQRYCCACHAAYMRAWRPKYGKMKPLERFKSRARAYANVYERRGKLKRRPCEACGARAEKHHPNYQRPLDVVWLCRPCHLELHQAEERVAA